MAIYICKTCSKEYKRKPSYEAHLEKCKPKPKPKIGLKRDTTDKFYTSPKIVSKCIEKIKQNVTICADDLCIEPSAGNGSFIEGIQTLSSNSLFYDIKPENELIVEQDYLKYDYSKLTGNIHIIGNPPFGRQSSLAIQFIKLSCKFASSISFILPKSFKKDSLKKHFDLSFHLINEWDLPVNSFLVGEKEHDVPCVFQIWVKKENPRLVPKKLEPNGFKFVKKEDAHDISFRRVGINAGDISRETADKSFQSHYFIKFSKKLTQSLYDKLEAIKYKTKENTVGPKSISKQELIKEFNKIV